MAKRRILIGLAVALTVGGALALAQKPASEPPALKVAMARFRSESQEALAPVQKRHRARLEALKRDLLRKGDRDGAAAVADELGGTSRPEADRISSWVEGTWRVRYDQGLTRTYKIRGDGMVFFVETETVGQIIHTGDDWLLDFNDGKLERLILKPAIRVEHFNPKADFLATGKPAVTGIAEKVK